LQHWLNQQAAVHHRSVSTEIITLLEMVKAKSAPIAAHSSDERLALMMEISRKCAALPELDPRSADEIIGYDSQGIPV
jgi:hypothetical protein